MEYRRFAELRQESCDEFESRLATARRSPRSLGFQDLEELSLRYRKLLHDHSLAQARFPGTAMARRLRRLVLDGTHWLQRDSGEHLPSPRRFVLHTFPRTFQSLLGVIGASAGVFVLAGLFGFALTTMEPTLGSLFLPAESVAGLARGELWTESIFAVLPGAVASSFIATNNLSVALTAWAGGALAGAGALHVLLLNGLMLGSVLALTAQYSMASPLLEFVAAHGPLEITMILVSAGAGLHMGRALVVASDRPRAEVLRRAGKEALVVLFGCLPWILVLGFVEGFLSPSPQLSAGVKAFLGLLLECVFLAWALSPTWKSAPEVST